MKLIPVKNQGYVAMFRAGINTIHGGQWWRLAVCACAGVWGLTGLAHAQSPVAGPVTTEVVVIDEPAETPQAWLQLYGVRLSTATRDEMRKAIQTQGLRAQREDNRYWVDVYDAKGLMPGVTQLHVGYLGNTQKLVFAEYVFASFMEPEGLVQVMDRVRKRYGDPHRVEGEEGMGSYLAVWRMPEGMEVHVSREWPETTAYMKFVHRASYAQMREEVDREVASRQEKEKPRAAAAVATVRDGR